VVSKVNKVSQSSVRRQMMTDKEKQEAATQFLRNHGFNWSGQEQGKVNSKQDNFERSRMIPSPMGGQPPRK